MLLCAFKSTCEQLLPAVLPSCDIPANFTDICTPSFSLSWQPGCTGSYQVYGHRAVKLSDDLTICTGGFGLRSNQSHGRIQNLTLVNNQSFRVDTVEVSGYDGSPSMLESMYHTVTLISEKTLLLIGGRKSPTKPCPLVRVLDLTDLVRWQQTEDPDFSSTHSTTCDDPCISRCRVLVKNITSEGPVPHVRWRHSVSLAVINGKCLFAMSNMLIEA